MIYTSHYMEEVQTLCKRIAILDNGLLRACDTLPNLLKRLETTIRVTVSNPPGGFAERLAALPGVKRVAGNRTLAKPQAAENSAFELVVEDIGPVLAKVASECAASGADLASATTTEPTLERVFLHLTGRGLRD